MSKDGQHIPVGNSFASRFIGEPLTWVRPLNDVTFGAIATKGAYTYTNTDHGLLYVLDNATGNVVWQFNGKASKFTMNGGADRALILKDRVIWINAYDAPIVNNSGGSKWGNVFTSDPCIKFLGETDKLNGLTYWNGIDTDNSVFNAWRIIKDQLLVEVSQPEYAAVIPAALQGNLVLFDDPISQSDDSLIRYAGARFLNINTYVLKYFNVSTCELITEYMNLLVE